MKITIINGPNLNLLGKRESGIYGHKSFEEFFTEMKADFEEVEFTYFQSNVEGELVDALQQSEADGIVLNAAAYTHTSVALGDAVAAIGCPVVEVHISNIQARQSFRHHSYIAPRAAGIISGFGLQGYRLAVEALQYSLRA